MLRPRIFGHRCQIRTVGLLLEDGPLQVRPHAAVASVILTALAILWIDFFRSRSPRCPAYPCRRCPRRLRYHRSEQHPFHPLSPSSHEFGLPAAPGHMWPIERPQRRHFAAKVLRRRQWKRQPGGDDTRKHIMLRCFRPEPLRGLAGRDFSRRIPPQNGHGVIAGSPPGYRGSGPPPPQA